MSPFLVWMIVFVFIWGLLLLLVDSSSVSFYKFTVKTSRYKDRLVVLYFESLGVRDLRWDKVSRLSVPLGVYTNGS